MEKKSTRQRIVEESLTLFSQYGYNGTSVKKIAEAVGIKDSSIYKHFASKQEIFDEIAATISERIRGMSLEMGLPDEDNLIEQAHFYAGFSVETLTEFTRKIVLFYLTDPYIVQFRKLAIREQFSNEVIYEAYRYYYMESSIKFMSSLFQEMMVQGSLKKSDPEMAAYLFYSPIFLLIHKFEGRETEIEDALELLEGIVAEFYKLYFPK